MFSAAFDTLRANHPEALTTLELLKAKLEHSFELDPNAIVDDDIVLPALDGEAGFEEEIARDVLVELVGLGALARRLFWACPVEGGTFLEADDVEEFPLVAPDCDRCGRPHHFRQEDVSVHFIVKPTPPRGEP